MRLRSQQVSAESKAKIVSAEKALVRNSSPLVRAP